MTAGWLNRGMQWQHAWQAAGRWQGCVGQLQYGTCVWRSCRQKAGRQLLGDLKQLREPTTLESTLLLLLLY